MSDFVALYTPPTSWGVRWQAYVMYVKQAYDMHAKFYFGVHIARLL